MCVMVLCMVSLPLSPAPDATARPLENDGGRPILPRHASASTDVQRRMRAMLPKFAIAGLAATAFVAATALTPTGAAAGGRGGGAGNFPQYGT
jgi:hypothetical protein